MSKLTFKKLPKEQAEKMMQEVEAAIAARNRPFEGTRSTGVRCVIPSCPGHIAEQISRVYRGDPMHRIIGPGGTNQMTTVTALYCPECGIKYHRLPKKVKDTQG